MPEVDDFLAGLDGATRSAYERVVAVALAVAPGADQGRSYGLPVLRHRGKPLVGFAVAKRHCSVHPFSGSAVTAAADLLAGFDLGKGTVRFTPDRPLPDEAVRVLLEHRRDEIEGG